MASQVVDTIGKAQEPRGCRCLRHGGRRNPPWCRWCSCGYAGWWRRCASPRRLPAPVEDGEERGKPWQPSCNFLDSVEHGVPPVVVCDFEGKKNGAEVGWQRARGDQGQKTNGRINKVSQSDGAFDIVVGTTHKVLAVGVLKAGNLYEKQKYKKSSITKEGLSEKRRI